MPDPAAVRGDEATRRAAFAETVAVLRRRIDALLRMPVEDLARPALEARVKDIGAIP
jgi:hypothetical protein